MQGGLQHFVIGKGRGGGGGGGGKNCMDMDTCSMHVYPTCLKVSKEIIIIIIINYTNEPKYLLRSSCKVIKSCAMDNYAKFHTYWGLGT